MNISYNERSSFLTHNSSFSSLLNPFLDKSHFMGEVGNG